MPNKTVKDFLEKHGPFAQAALMAHNNDHTGAYRFIANYYGLTSHTKVFDGIAMIHSEELEMFDALDTIRRKWAKYLHNWVEQNASLEDKLHLRGLV